MQVPQKKPSTTMTANPDEMETQVMFDMFDESETLAALNADRKKSAEEAEEEKLTDDELLESVDIHDDPFIPESPAYKRPAYKRPASKLEASCKNEGGGSEENEEQEGEENVKENDRDPFVDGQEAQDPRQEGGSLKARCIINISYEGFRGVCISIGVIYCDWVLVRGCDCSDGPGEYAFWVRMCTPSGLHMNYAQYMS